MRALVTGGAGFIGSHVVDALVDAGHEVLVVDDLSTGKRERVAEGIQFEHVDIRDADSIARIFTDFQPEVVNHHAAQADVTVSVTDPVEDASINLLGSLGLIRQSVLARVKRFVFASSGGAIYGEVPKGQQARIDWPARPRTPYGCAKLAVEHYLGVYQREFGLPCTILRYANVYGPRQEPEGEAGVVAIFVRNLLAGKPIRVNARSEPGDAGCIRDYVFVGDVVGTNLAAMRGELESSVANVATGVATTTLDLARAVELAVGVEADVSYGPPREADIECSVLDGGDPSEQAVPHTDLATGLAATVAWFQRRT